MPDFVQTEAAAIVAHQGHPDLTRINGASAGFKGG
jgi:hypothetical protein